MDFGKLWQNFLDTVQNHYFDTSGRVGLQQFWYFMLVEFLIYLGLIIIQHIALAGILAPLFSLAMLLPNAGMAIRRMHDGRGNEMLVWAAIGAAGLLQVLALLAALGGFVGTVLFATLFLSFGWLILLVAFGCTVAALYFCLQPGVPEANQYGPVPPAFSPK